MKKLSSGQLKFFRNNRIFLYFCLVLGALFSATNFDIQPIQPSIDASYYYVYSSIFLGNFHSSSVALTYGPLGFLVHALAIGAMKWWLLSIYVAFGLLLGWLVYLTTKSLIGGKRYIIALIFTLLVSIQVFEWKLLAAYLILLFYAYEKKSVRALIIASVVATVFLHIKLSLGILGVLSLGYVAWLVRVRLNDSAKITAGFIISMFVIGGLLFRLSYQQMFSYFRNGLDVSGGYTAAMSLQPTNWLKFLLVIGIAGSLGYVLVFWLLPKKDKPLIILGLLSGFFVWKAAVVRQDPYGHVESLAFFAAFIFFLYFFFISQVRRVKIHKVYYGLIIVFTAAVFYGVYLNGYTPARFKTTISYPLTFWKVEICLLGPCKKPDILTLDPELRKALGDSSVDVYPWEELIIEANKLNWAPRPSPASYGTYTPHLDNLNANFFASHQAPEKLIWDSREGILSIDGRHIFFDEPASLRSMLQNYDLRVYKAPYFVLARNNTFSLPKEEVIDETKTIWNKWVEIPVSGDTVSTKIKYKSSASQKVSELVLHSDPVSIKIRRKSGLESTYRTVPKNLSQGIMISQLPGNIEELQQVFERKAINDPVIAYQLIGNGKIPILLQHNTYKY